MLPEHTKEFGFVNKYFGISCDLFLPSVFGFPWPVEAPPASALITDHR
jgi:hypothetical protein